MGFNSTFKGLRKTGIKNEKVTKQEINKGEKMKLERG